MSERTSLKIFPVEVNVFIDTDTPIGQFFLQADEATQREVAVDTLREGLRIRNGGSVTCRFAISGENPGFDTVDSTESIPA